MISKLERLIAFRYLRSRRKEGFISVIAGFSLLGIALGVGTLIVVMAVMNGFRNELMDRILGVSGHVMIYPAQSRNISEYEDITQSLIEITDVRTAIPMVEGQVMALANGNSTGAYVKGMGAKDVLLKPYLSETLLEGNVNALTEKQGVFLGIRLAQHLRLKIGDSITLIAPEGNYTVMGMMPRMKEYEIVGVFEVGMYEFDRNTIIMALDAAQLYFKRQNAVSSIEVMVEDPHDLKEVLFTVRQFLGPQFVVTSWIDANAGFFNALKVERTVMFLILTLIIVVAAFNIISSLIMLVNDKTRDIAILRTMGVSRVSILRIFLTCGASIGVVGTILGFILGLSFSLNIESIRQGLESLLGFTVFDPVIYFLSELPADVQTADVIKVVLMGLVLSFLATIYPAWKAAKLHPAEVLRYE